eukprot:m.221710 g.221710  ORF g.221710 m.221710 type:complete len:169 (+) comp10811_c1_seq4:319-825(+)
MDTGATVGELQRAKTTKPRRGSHPALPVLLVQLKPRASVSVVPGASPRTKRASRAADGAKCFKVIVGGTDLPLGRNNGIDKEQGCDKLRCTACDFKVCIFDDYRWSDECQYLFFRNNIPDFDKLKPMLHNAPGTRAYACQCSWMSVDDQTELQYTESLKWVCGKHSSQ